MNALIQLESMLIGSQEAVLELEKKHNARLLIIADTHGAYDVVKEIITDFGKEADALIFCGDGFCDLAAYIEEAAVDEKLQSLLPPVIAAVRGNGDAEMYPVKLNANKNEDTDIFHKIMLPYRILFSAAGRNILAVHGHRHGVDLGTATLISSAYTMDADMVFFGHTHRAHWEETSGTLILNPGSCSASRNRFPPTFALVSFPGDRERYNVEFFAIEETLFKNYKFMRLVLQSN